MTTNTAFALGLITSALQMIFVMLSWILTSYLGRRTIYLYGSFFNVVMLVALGLSGPGLPRPHHLGAVHPGSRARLVGHHRRDVVHPPQASHHWNWPRFVL